MVSKHGEWTCCHLRCGLLQDGVSCLLYFLLNLLTSSSRADVRDGNVLRCLTYWALPSDGQGAWAGSTFPRWKAVTSSQVCVTMGLRGEAWRQAVAGTEPYPSKEHRERSLGGGARLPQFCPAAQPLCCGPVCSPQARASSPPSLWSCPLCSRVESLLFGLGLEFPLLHAFEGCNKTHSCMCSNAFILCGWVFFLHYVCVLYACLLSTEVRRGRPFPWNWS